MKEQSGIWDAESNPPMVIDQVVTDWLKTCVLGESKFVVIVFVDSRRVGQNT